MGKGNSARGFACASPIPEIWPWEAKEAGAKIVARGRSDFENQSDWWIYENWRAVPGGEAIVHKGNCPWCNHGRGIHWKRRKTSDKNGRWHGPYPTKNDALAQAQRLRRRETRSCKYCCHLSVQRGISCPDCGQPMTKNPKRAEHLCENPRYPVISVRPVGSSTRVLRSIEEKKTGNEAECPSKGS